MRFATILVSANQVVNHHAHANEFILNQNTISSLLQEEEKIFRAHREYPIHEQSEENIRKLLEGLKLEFILNDSVAHAARSALHMYKGRTYENMRLYASYNLPSAKSKPKKRRSELELLEPKEFSFAGHKIL